MIEQLYLHRELAILVQLHLHLQLPLSFSSFFEMRSTVSSALHFLEHGDTGVRISWMTTPFQSICGLRITSESPSGEWLSL